MQPAELRGVESRRLMQFLPSIDVTACLYRHFR
jgi:hypothetical protein